MKTNWKQFVADLKKVHANIKKNPMKLLTPYEVAETWAAIEVLSHGLCRHVKKQDSAAVQYCLDDLLTLKRKLDRHRVAETIEKGKNHQA